ncbi:hypothetical protein [uncultured Thiohalocapsa sp.]|uniref:hypothetical protein n=1 Tax=uncultured Thiohalocapsa sp. TaxID=768990 RepID=UPI0025DBBE76|nr:hypothetical protein [uncultured Thiohalocapsa sp.]
MPKDFNDDPHLDVCQNIEVGLREQYDRLPGLIDTQCMFALDSAKVAIKQQFGYARNERVNVLPGTEGIIDWCVAIGQARIGDASNLTLKEDVACLEKIKRSVKRHSEAGPRGYYAFIRHYV